MAKQKNIELPPFENSCTIPSEEAEQLLHWPLVRQKLVKGLSEVLQSERSLSFENALTEARMTGLYDKAMKDASWRAQAIIDIKEDGVGFGFVLDAYRQQGFLFKEIGPLVYNEWLFKLHRQLLRKSDQPFFDLGVENRSNSGGPWVWLKNTMLLARNGFDFYDQQKQTTSVPLPDAFQIQLANILIPLFERSKEDTGIKEYLDRLLGDGKRFGVIPGFKNKEEAFNHYYVFWEKGMLQTSIPKNAKSIKAPSKTL